MSDRRPPGFNVDLGFYDSQEVLSIPRKIRAAAVGVWTLAGCYSASKLTDGLVYDEKLRELGCTPAIRAALMSTKPEPLWVAADDHPGAIQFTRWAKWQRTNAEVKAYREADAERKRRARAGATSSPRDAHVPIVNNANDPHVDATCAPDDAYMPVDMEAMYPPDVDHRDDLTSTNDQTSARTTAGRPHNVRAESGNPRGRARARQSETKSESESSLLTLVEGGMGGDPKLPVAAKAAPADARGKRLPENWRPSDETIAAMREQFPHLDLKAIHIEFVDYWCAVPGAKGRKTNWDATWRNRVREIAGRNLPARNGHSPPNGVGKPTLKALGYQTLADEIIAEMDQP